MMTKVETRLRRATLADGLGAALVLACALLLAAGSWTALRRGSALFHLGAPAVAAAAIREAPIEVASCVPCPR
jgi:hypothetical protein